MKLNFFNLILLCLLGLYSTITSAINLCDANCSLMITFPEGGEIIANEPMTITFGDNGLINTVSTNTAYLAGEFVFLNTNESIVFGSGGYFDIGESGNLDFTQLTFNTIGVITLEAKGGAKTIQIPENGKLAILGGASLNINSSFSSSGTLEIGERSALNIQSNDDFNSCEVSTNSGVTLTATAVDSLILDNNLDCEDAYIMFSDTSFISEGSISVIDSSLNLSYGTITINESTPLPVGELVLSSTEDSEGSGMLDLYFLIFVFLLNIYKIILPQKE